MPHRKGAKPVATDVLSTDFDLDAAVTVSELRRETDWVKRLEQYGKLRVERRGRGPSAIIGVMVLPEVWRAMKEIIERLDAVDEAEVARLIGERSGAKRVRGKELLEQTRTLLGEEMRAPGR